jgi:hypothetical protein
MSALKLYELTDSFKKIFDMIDENEPDEALKMALAEIGGAIEVKADGMAKLIKSLDYDVDIYKAEEKRLADRRRAIENKRNWFKNYLKEQMEKVGKDKIKLPTITLALQSSPPAVNITDNTAIPAKYITIIPELHIPDKKAILEALKAGQDVPGTEMTQGKHLRIR